ncbi:hypothetical protein ACLMAB_28900 [Brevibacillus laterosporus]
MKKKNVLFISGFLVLSIVGGIIGIKYFNDSSETTMEIPKYDYGVISTSSGKRKVKLPYMIKIIR